MSSLYPQSNKCFSFQDSRKLEVKNDELGDNDRAFHLV